MTPHFSFVSGALDRAAHLRGTTTAREDASARTLVFWRGKLLVGADGQPLLSLLDHPSLAEAREPAIFLGLTPDGPRFAIDLNLWVPIEDAATIGEFVDQSQQVHPGWADSRFAEIRGLMPTLSPLEGECVATGRALLGWHATHQFCANCANQTATESAGWVRRCQRCGTQHFPRTDPVVIMAITRGDQLLLGRGPSWPEGMYSLLAGFVEPGETIESAVRREVYEESRIAVGPVRYVASQPWPFPMSLMFGCHGEATSQDITIDPIELADARWVSKSEVRQILDGTHQFISRPRNGAIAGALIEAWAKDRLLDPTYWEN